MFRHPLLIAKYSAMTSGRVDAADYAEAEPLLDAGALLELDVVDGDPGELVAAGDLAVLHRHRLLLGGSLLSPTGHVVHTVRPESIIKMSTFRISKFLRKVFILAQNW